MSNSTISPNMGLIIPTVGQDPGPDWANNINASLGILDQHNHSNGQGVQITTAGININTDLPLNSNNLTSVNSVRFNNLLATLPGSAPNLGCIYEAVNELYYNDGVGNVVQITKAGNINATSSGISSGTASASFSGGVLVVDANVNTPANVQGASFLFGNNVSGSNYLTLQPPNAMASSYSVTLPPINTTGGTVLLSYDTSNNIGIGPVLVAGQITTAGIQNNAITQPLLALRPSASTASIGQIAICSPVTQTATGTGNVDITGLTVTITTSGRPVFVILQPGASNSVGVISINDGPAQIEVVTSGTGYIYLTELGSNTASVIDYAPSIISYLDMSTNGLAGTYTYSVSAIGSSGGTTSGFANVVMVAYEI